MMGCSVGTDDGSVEGINEGSVEGIDDGTEVAGKAEGTEVDSDEGPPAEVFTVGLLVGGHEGFTVGLLLGISVG